MNARMTGYRSKTEWDEFSAREWQEVIVEGMTWVKKIILTSFWPELTESYGDTTVQNMLEFLQTRENLGTPAV